MKLTDAEWSVLEILWSSDHFSLGEVTAALQTINGWNKNTVYTYLTRMASKGLVSIARGSSQPYSAAVSRDFCARQERDELLKKVYHGAAGNLITAFLKESSISQDEIAELKKLLDGMEV